MKNDTLAFPVYMIGDEAFMIVMRDEHGNPNGYKVDISTDHLDRSPTTLDLTKLPDDTTLIIPAGAPPLGHIEFRATEAQYAPLEDRIRDARKRYRSEQRAALIKEKNLSPDDLKILGVKS